MHKIILSVVIAILVCTPSLVFSAEGDLDASFGQSGVVTFNKGGGSFADAMVRQPDGRMIIVGTVAGVLNADILVMRLNPDGSRDSSFGLDGIVIFDGPSHSEDSAKGVALMPDGRIVVAGLTSNGSDNDVLVFRLNANGGRDVSFGGGSGSVQYDLGGNEVANDVVLRPDNRIVLTGVASNATGNDILIMRLNVDGGLDTSFGGTGSVIVDRGGNDSGKAVALQADGRIVVAGQSSNGLNGDLIVLRRNVDGAPDISFNGTGIVIYDNGGRDTGNAVSIQADGRIVVAGTSSNGLSDDLLVVRLLQNGALDPSFNSTGDTPGVVLLDGAAQGADVANAMALQANNKIVVTGFSSNGLVDDVIVVRLNPDGAPDTTFGVAGAVTYHASDFGDAEGNATVIQPDGYILAAGTGANRLSSFVFVLRFDPNGLLDPTFNAGGVVTFRQRVNTAETANAVALLPNGKIVAAGQTSGGVANDILVMRFRSDGSRDTTFSGDGIAFFDGGGDSNDIARGVAIQSDGKVVVAGQTSNGVNSDVLMLRYRTDGSLDPLFNGSGAVQFNGAANNEDIGRAVAVQADGKIVVVGQTSNGVDSDLLLLRYTGAGLLDTTFGAGGVVRFGGVGNEIGRAVAIQDDGRIVVAGVRSNGTDTDLLLVRFGTDGTPDATFGTGGAVTYDGGGDDAGRAVAVQSDGKIVVAGSAFNGTKNVALVVRYSSGGILDISFNGNGVARYNSGKVGDDGANGVAVQADGKIVVTGFRNASNVLVLRYLEDGTLDSSFSGDGVATYNGPSNGVDIGNALALQLDGKIVVAGVSDNDVLVLRFIGQKLRLLAPNGGEKLAAGSLFNIEWTSPPNAVSFNLQLSLDNGVTWSSIATDLAVSPYPWTVPTPLGTKTQCLVRVKGFDTNGAKVATDQSNAVFSIEPVTLTAPNGGEPFTSGDTVTITWTTHATKQPVAAIKLSYTINGGTTWNAIDTSADPSDDGIFTWTAPLVAAVKKARVKIVLKDSSGRTLGSDASDAVFRISPP